MYSIPERNSAAFQKRLKSAAGDLIDSVNDALDAICKNPTSPGKLYKVEDLNDTNRALQIYVPVYRITIVSSRFKLIVRVDHYATRIHVLEMRRDWLPDFLKFAPT